MPKIKGCDASECSYNRSNACHALAITVGDVNEPKCDTFFQTDAQGGSQEDIGQVGACKMQQCQHNQSLECTAESIQVSHKGNKVDCMTFQASS
ncbi:MAG: DUF1540 domain-containing protein [Phycisphaerae bacterium]